MIRFLTTIALLGSCAVCAANETDNCSDLVGQWQGDRFEHATNENVQEASVFLADGRFFVRFDMDDGLQTRSQFESGYYSCNGNKLIIATTAVNNHAFLNIAIYEILELNSAYIKVALQSTDCSRVHGQCEGAVHEATRLPEAEPCC